MSVGTFNQKEEIFRYYREPLLLSTQAHPRVRLGRVILSYSLSETKPWRFFLKSTQSRTTVSRYLISKLLLSRLRSEESLILFDLAAENPQLAILLNNSQSWKELLVERGLRRKTRVGIGESLVQRLRRVSNGEEPKFSAFKVWAPVRIPPECRIGVGYKDKGSLSTAPSWRDQMVLTEEDEPLTFSDSFLEELRILLSFLEFSERNDLQLKSPS